jgi:hypothetical protein
MLKACGAGRGGGYLAALPVSLALVAGLAGPLAYSIDTAATAHTGASPSAGPTVTGAGGFGGRGAFGGTGGFTGGRTGRFGDFGDFGDFSHSGDFDGSGDFGGGGRFGRAGGTSTLNATLAKLLETGASSYQWVAATDGSDSAAALELRTDGLPVMAIGGFSGGDPTPTLAAFEQMVAAHEVHYFIADGTGGTGGGFGGRGGASSDASQITSWVEAHFTAKTVGGETVYDLTAPTSGS